MTVNDGQYRIDRLSPPLITGSVTLSGLILASIIFLSGPNAPEVISTGFVNGLKWSIFELFIVTSLSFSAGWLRDVNLKIACICLAIIMSVFIYGSFLTIIFYGFPP